jgi:hypothetical protein
MESGGDSLLVPDMVRQIPDWIPECLLVFPDRHMHSAPLTQMQGLPVAPPPLLGQQLVQLQVLQLQ